MKKYFSIIIIILMTVGIGCNYAHPHEYTDREDVSPAHKNELDPMTMEDWIQTRADTSRALDRALTEIPMEIDAFHARYPEASKSQWPYLTYGQLWEGPYAPIGRLSLREMPRMFEYILEGPSALSGFLSDSFRYFVSRANPDVLTVDDQETRSELIKRYAHGAYVMPIYRFLQNARTIDQRLDELMDGSQDGERIYQATYESGVGALPYYYDKIIINQDSRLLKYAHLVIPCWLKYENPSRVVDESTDEEVVREALSRCGQDVQGVLDTIKKYESIIIQE